MALTNLFPPFITSDLFLPWNIWFYCSTLFPAIGPIPALLVPVLLLFLRPSLRGHCHLRPWYESLGYYFTQLLSAFWQRPSMRCSTLLAISPCSHQPLSWWPSPGNNHPVFFISIQSHVPDGVSPHAHASWVPHLPPWGSAWLILSAPFTFRFSLIGFLELCFCTLPSLMNQGRAVGLFTYPWGWWEMVEKSHSLLSLTLLSDLIGRSNARCICVVHLKSPRGPHLPFSVYSFQAEASSWVSSAEYQRASAKSLYHVRMQSSSSIVLSPWGCSNTDWNFPLL